MNRIGVVSLVVLLAVAASSTAVIAGTSVSVGLVFAGPTSIELSWSRSEDTCFESYTIQYRAPGAATWNDGPIIERIEETHGSVSGLAPGTTYNLRIRDADCLPYDGYSNVIEVTTPTGGMAILGVGLLLTMILVFLLVLAGIVAVTRWLKHSGVDAARRRSPPPPPAVLAPVVPSTPPPPAFGSGPKPSLAPPPRGAEPQASPRTAAGSDPSGKRSPPAKFCARCGAPLKGPFCGNCRFKNW